MSDRTFDRISRGLATTTSRRHALKLFGGGALAAAGIGAVGLSAVNDAAAQTIAPDPSAIPISGTVADISSFVGSFDLDRFRNVGGDLVAVGTLTGALTDLVTGLTETVNQVISLPVIGATGTCEILDLVLGPLDLDLLGLQVHLDQVVLNITAQSGPGNLLGNLLCAVAGLLDGPGPLGAIAGLLNNILRVLG